MEDGREQASFSTPRIDYSMYYLNYKSQEMSQEGEIRKTKEKWMEEGSTILET